MFPKCLIVVLALAAVAFSQTSASRRVAWNRPFAPFHLIANIYYVGSAGLSSFLIETNDGFILLDGGLTETAPLIDKSIAQLGFAMRDVKILLNSHAHFDHAGGLAQLQQASGARVIASDGDAPTLNRDFHLKVDRIVHDGDTVQFGGVTITAHATPGHTPGCTTWTMPVKDAGKILQVVFYCSTSVVDRLVNNRQYPQIVSDYEQSFAKLRKLPCDVFLGPHPEFFHLAEKRAKLPADGPNPFVDPTELAKFIDRSEQDFRLELKDQQAAAKRH